LVRQALQTSQRLGHSNSSSGKQRITVSRMSVLYEGVQALMSVGGSALLLDVDFAGEAGTGNGPTCEFFSLMARAFRGPRPCGWPMWYLRTSYTAPSPSLPDGGASPQGSPPVLVATGTAGLFPHPAIRDSDSDEESATALEALGRLIGRSLRERRHINVPLHGYVIDALLGRFDYLDEAEASLFAATSVLPHNSGASAAAAASVAVGDDDVSMGSASEHGARKGSKSFSPLSPLSLGKDAVSPLKETTSRRDTWYSADVSPIQAASALSSSPAHIAAVGSELDSVAFVDPDLAKSLLSLLQMSADDVASLELYFSFPGTNVPLIIDGLHLPVTGANVASYVSTVCRFMLGAPFRFAIERIAHGIAALISPMALTLFTSREFDLILRGPQGKPWPSSAVVLGDIVPDHGYTEKSKPILWLASVVAEWDETLQRKFLMFISGTDAIGEEGLHPKLTVVRRAPNAESPARDRAANAGTPLASPAGGGGAEAANSTPLTASSPVSVPQMRGEVPMQVLIDASLPTVNTCFHYLKLPDYSSRDVLKARLHSAITDGQGVFLLS
jgi:hypothetical protein